MRPRATSGAGPDASPTQQSLPDVDPVRPLVVAAITPVGAVGGAEAMLVRVLGAAAERGWEVSCLAPPGPVQERLRAAGVRVVPGPEIGVGRGPLPWGTATLALRALRAAVRLSRCGEADVLVVNGLPAMLPLRLLAPGCAVVYYAHDVVFSGRRAALLSLGRPALDVAAAVSEAVATALRTTGLPCEVVRNGTAMPAGLSTAEVAGPLLVGCNAALTEWKGQHVLLEAVAQLPRHPHVVVELLGRVFPGSADRAYAGRLRRRAEQPDLHGRVRFLGHSTDPLAVMRRWRVAVSASTGPEASGLAVLEAMSLGLPQVCTDHGGPPEVLQDAGLLVPPADPAALSEALEQLLSDPEAWSTARAAGPPAAANYSPRRQCDEFLDLLRRHARRGPLAGRALWARPLSRQTTMPKRR